MNSINIEIERVKKSFFIQRLTNELETLEKDTPKHQMISKIHTEITQNTNKLDDTMGKVEASIYTKKWVRLPEYYKIKKITEYMNEKHKDNPERKTIEDKLIQLVKDGKLNSCKFVKYDTEKCQIEKIILSKSETY